MIGSKMYVILNLSWRIMSSEFLALNELFSSYWWIRYAPGDVAVIHPIALVEEVEAFINAMGWGDSADKPVRIVHNVTGTQLLVQGGILLSTFKINLCQTTCLGLQPYDVYLADTWILMPFPEGLFFNFCSISRQMNRKEKS